MALSTEVTEPEAQDVLNRERVSYWRDPTMWALVVLALAVRIAYNLFLHTDGHTLNSFVIDEREYFGAASMLAEGRGFSFYDTALWVRPPLYVSSLALIIKLAGDSYLPMLIFQSILSALTLPAMGWLAMVAAGRKAGWWTVLLGLLYLPFTLFAGLLLSETLFVFLFAWSLVLLLLAREWLAGASHNSRVRGVLLLAAAGFLLGLGVLTRSTALGFVPLSVLWLIWGNSIPLRRRLLSGLVMLAVCGLTIVPWVARNYAAYGHILIDSTGGYNLWLGSIGVRDETRLQADLLTIPNPAERESYAYSQGLAEIAANPAGFVAKGIKESLDLWRPSFGAEERQVKGFALGRVPAFHLVSLFLFDDVLYLAILVLAVFGLALGPPHPLKSLTGLWVLLWVVISFIFFAVTRFRLPIMAALIPWAGVGLASLGHLRTRVRALSRSVQVTSGIAIVAIVAIVIPSISLEDTSLGIERWTQQAPYREAEGLLENGLVAQAVAQYRLANQDITDTRYGLAAALLQENEPALATAVLRSDEPDDRFEPLIIKGEAALMSGDLNSARSLFNARVVQVAGASALDWAWDHLDPPLTNTLQIGSGLDIGYIRGFYGPETAADGTQYRWSSSSAQIRWSGGVGETTFSWNGWRPQDTDNAVVTLYRGDGVFLENGAFVKRFDGVDRWLRELGSVLTPSPTPGYSYYRCRSDSCLQILVNGFIGTGLDPRLLGIRVSSITVNGNK